VAGPGYTGDTLFNTLNDSARGKGTTFYSHCVVDRLVVDADNRIIGVEAIYFEPGTSAREKHLKLIRKVNAYQRFIEKSALKAAARVRDLEEQAGERVYFRADKAVILTTGSFAFNREMVRRYAPKFRNAMPLGTISCDGSGLELGASVGGALGYMDSVTAWRSISPPTQFVQGIVVNREGRRFVAEDVYLGRLGHELAQQTEQRAWVIIDGKAYWSAYKDTIPQPGEEGYLEFRGPLLMNLLFNATRGKTLEKLGEKCGIEAGGLRQEVAEYNSRSVAGEDRFGKKQSNCRPIDDGAYYAIDISVGSKKFPCPTIPMGGLKVDEETGQVLSESGAPIEGLYAAGRAAVGIPSGFYVSGSSLADCIFSGRRAGAAAAQVAVADRERAANA
jgi:3-oxo-5alpha-steroid 4-dehydrogenase